jgi:hypothetical protein
VQEKRKKEKKNKLLGSSVDGYRMVHCSDAGHIDLY